MSNPMVRITSAYMTREESQGPVGRRLRTASRGVPGQAEAFADYGAVAAVRAARHEQAAIEGEPVADSFFRAKASRPCIEPVPVSAVAPVLGPHCKGESMG